LLSGYFNSKLGGVKEKEFLKNSLLTGAATNFEIPLVKLPPRPRIDRCRKIKCVSGEDSRSEFSRTKVLQ